LRLRDRSPRDAQIWDGRLARLLRRRSALAQALRLLGARRAHAERGSRGMKFTIGWLKQHLDTDPSDAEIVDALTRGRLEVEGVDNPGEKRAAFRVARVLTAERHPQADKLQVLTVDTGEGVLQVVCGAPNARAGLVGVFGSAGAVVPANGMVLKVAAI